MFYTVSFKRNTVIKKVYNFTNNLFLVQKPCLEIANYFKRLQRKMDETLFYDIVFL